MTKTKLLKRVDALNEILASELGRNIYGAGQYKWRWSEDLLHPMAEMEEVDGRMKPVMEYRADSETGLILAQQKYVLRKECPSLDNQWVLCKWIPPMDPRQWRRIFGSSLEWPGNGDYAPISAAGSGNYASLSKGEDPTESTTWLAIQTIRAHRATDHRKDAYETERRMNDKDEKLKQTLIEDIRELGTIAGRPVQKSLGDKDYSFGGTEPTTKETSCAS